MRSGDGGRARAGRIAALIAGFAMAATAARAQWVNEVKIEVRDGYRYITSNGIPDHEPGQFPNAGNPNTISPQRYAFRVPEKPTAAEGGTGSAGWGQDGSGGGLVTSGPGRMPGGRPAPPPLFGVAINGVPFDPGTAEFWNNDPMSGWHFDALSGRIDLGVDENNGHVQPNGAYHYHGLPTGLIRRVARDNTMTLVGYAADGFPIYAQMGYVDPGDLKSGIRAMHSSYQLREGKRPSADGGPGGVYDGTFVEDFIYVGGSGDLDEFNGRTGVTEEYPGGTYYYVLTREFPFVPRLFRGEADPSFARQGPDGGLWGPGGPRGRLGGPRPRLPDRAVLPPK